MKTVILLERTKEINKERIEIKRRTKINLIIKKERKNRDSLFFKCPKNTQKGKMIHFLPNKCLFLFIPFPPVPFHLSVISVPIQI